MKKVVAFLLCVVMMLTMATPVLADVQTSNLPTRMINLVYDDSGSMISTGGQTVDTWCQAKYAVEVFAAMLGEKDTMNVYYMSEFEGNGTRRPKLSLSGSDGTATNVKKVHDLVTKAGNTPFDSVIGAYNDLTQATADEKWLVILTDGVFEPAADIDGYFANKQSDIKVMFLGMGPNADGVTPDESRDIYYEQAQNNSEILNKLTGICTRVFNSQRLDVNVSSKQISFDIPMSELIVFAQGANVEIGGIKNADGKVFKSSSAPVTVKYSDIPATNYSNFIVDTGLLGSIATFKDDFVAGDYTLEVSGAETIEVYYKPNVAIAAYLKDANGKEIKNNTEIEAGDYTIEFGLVKTGTDEKIPESKLLGDVTYEAKVTNNGTLHENTYKSGDKITLTEGDLNIDVTGHYLKYYSVSTSLDYTIFKNKVLTFTVLENPQYTITSEGLEPDKPIVVKAQLDGRDLTAEEWASMGTPTGSIMEKVNFKLDDFKIQKMEDPGIYHVYPVLPDGKPSGSTYEGFDFGLNFDEEHGTESWSGNGTIPVNMTDSRSWIERNRDLFIRLVTFGGLFFLILGYMPFVKKYLPRELVNNPLIIKRDTEGEHSDIKMYGTKKRNYLSILIPYVPEKASIIMKGRMSTLEVKAHGKRTMVLLNASTFAAKPGANGRSPYVFGSECIKEGSKTYILPVNRAIIYTDGIWKCTCTLNKSK